MKAKIAVCASGEGSNFEAIVKAARAGAIQADVVGLICTRPKVGALGRADRLELPRKIIDPNKFMHYTHWDQAVLNQLKSWGVDWVVLAGFLTKIGPQTLKAFPNRIVNTHPSLLPKFGGAGMFGRRVHEAVLQAGEKESGVTVHLINEVYDAGQILAQASVPVVEGDTPDQLSDRVKALEISFYPKVLNDLVTGRIVTR